MAGIGVLRTIEGGTLALWCPGCETYHGVHVTGEHDHKWGWNGDYERPTFSPSLLVTSGHYLYGSKWLPNKVAGVDPCWCTWNRDHPEDEKPFECTICHSFVVDGWIQFLGDCTHKLCGQKVQLRREDDDMKYLNEAGEQPTETAAPKTEPTPDQAPAERKEPAPEPEQAKGPSPAERMAATAEKAQLGQIQRSTLEDRKVGDFVVKDLMQSQLEGMIRAGLTLERLPELMTITPKGVEQTPDAPRHGSMKGTAIGDILGRIYSSLELFEYHVATGAHADAREVHAYIADQVAELRGHFQS